MFLPFAGSRSSTCAGLCSDCRSGCSCRCCPRLRPPDRVAAQRHLSDAYGPRTQGGGLVLGVVVGWLGRSLMPGGESACTAAAPRHAAALPINSPSTSFSGARARARTDASPGRPHMLRQAEELQPLVDACSFQPVEADGHDVHCPQCAAMMCTEQCRYDASWCGYARDFMCTEDRLPADSVAFFPSIGVDPFPVPRCAPAQSAVPRTARDRRQTWVTPQTCETLKPLYDGCVQMSLHDGRPMGLGHRAI